MSMKLQQNTYHNFPVCHFSFPHTSYFKPPLITFWTSVCFNAQGDPPQQPIPPHKITDEQLVKIADAKPVFALYDILKCYVCLINYMSVQLEFKLYKAINTDSGHQMIAFGNKLEHRDEVPPVLLPGVDVVFGNIDDEASGVRMWLWWSKHQLVDLLFW